MSFSMTPQDQILAFVHKLLFRVMVCPASMMGEMIMAALLGEDAGCWVMSSCFGV